MDVSHNNTQQEFNALSIREQVLYSFN